MGTKNNPGEFDCYANAEDDEPMFIVLARDHRAPGVVRRWAKRYKREHEASGTFGEKQKRKYDEAIKCAKDMEEWKGNNAP